MRRLTLLHSIVSFFYTTVLIALAAKSPSCSYNAHSKA
jgi:uncharacterized membrane protein